MGCQAIGAINLADRIETWDPENQAKLREMGLRSSFELDDDEGHVFVAFSAEQYPTGVMGRLNAIGDLFVSSLISLPYQDFATAIDNMQRSGAELVLGRQAKELLDKMHQVEGIAPQPESMKEIWEIEEWGREEWVEQALAETAFAKHINVQHFPEVDELHGNVAGYRVRRATDNLVLIHSDGDEDIFVAVKLESTKREAYVMGWLRGSEGKVPQYYQKNCWFIPQEALHDMKELPGKERLQAWPMMTSVGRI
jgi:hypothetical protein